MRGTIIETGFIVGTNLDLLTATRLQTAPADGLMLFQVQASDNDATNNFKIDLQMPDSDVPMILQDVPCGEVTGFAYLDERTMLQYLTRIGKGGRVVFGLTEAGSAEATWRVVFTPDSAAYLLG